MPTSAQIEANRRNSEKSTDPRSPEGKASPRSNRPCYPEQAPAAGLLERGKSRFNALTSGIHAKSQVIPGEDAAELEALAGSYRQEFQPESPLEQFLVDAMVAADWQLRRLRKIEAQLWQRELTGADAAADLAEAYTRKPALAQIQRRIEATERSYYRALKQMQQIQKAEAEADRKWAEELRALPDEALFSTKPDPKLASISAVQSRNGAEPRPEAAPPTDNAGGQAASDQQLA